MFTAQGNTLLSLVNVRAFLTENDASLPGVNSTGARNKLDTSIQELEEHVASQTGHALSAKGTTRRQRTLRRELLRDQMAPIALIAKAELTGTPEIGPLMMPRGKPGTERLVGAAQGMAQAAAPHTAVFVANGLPADFGERLIAKAAELRDSLTTRANSRAKVKGVTLGLHARLVSARRTVHILDAFVRTALKDNPTLLGTWNRIKRVPKTRGGHAAVAAAVAALPAAATMDAAVKPTAIASSDTATATVAAAA
jgi:hypothetical protein